MGRDMNTDTWEQGIRAPKDILESEKYAMHVENIIRVEHHSDIRVRYFDGDGYTRGKDSVVDRRTGRALYSINGNNFDTRIVKLEKHEVEK